MATIASGLFAIAVTLGPLVLPERIVTAPDLLWSVLTALLVCVVVLLVTEEHVWARWSFAVQSPIRRARRPWTAGDLASSLTSTARHGTSGDPMAPMRRALDEARREQARASEPIPLRLVRDQMFEATTVVLDGARYAHCVFRNVTFRWLGGPWQLDEGNRLEGSINYETLSADAVNALDQLKSLRLLGNPDFGKSWGPRTLTVTQVVDDPLEVLFQLDDPIYSSIDRLSTGSPQQFRLGVRSRGARSVGRVRVRVLGLDGWVAGGWQTTPLTAAAEILMRGAYLRALHDAPPFQRSREGITIDPSTKPTLFLLASRQPGEQRFDILHTLGNDNLPLNPELPFRVRLELTGENLDPNPMAFKLWTSVDRQLLCTMLS